MIIQGALGQVPGNMTLPGRSAKHRFNQWGVFSESGNEDPHIGRCQIRITLKSIQQAVMQYLDLAHGSVTDMDLDRAILGRSNKRRRLIGIA